MGAKDINSCLIFTARFGGIVSVLLAVVFIINNFIIHVGGNLGVTNTPNWIQAMLIALAILGAFTYTKKMGSLNIDADRMDRISSYIIRAAFFGVLLVGVADAAISFIRVEGFHIAIFGQAIAIKLGLAHWRGVYIHIPLLVLSMLIAIWDRSVSVVWLVLLVVAAELLIVLTRFIFSYEQTFMGDLVRFWYAALFLFASAYTLKEDGHVRVDVFFLAFTPRKKAWVNAVGALVFGMPLCWLILVVGLAGKSSIINSPLLNFEISMSGFGMYVKYLMAGYLIVFALSMLVQFTSSFFNALAIIARPRMVHK